MKAISGVNVYLLCCSLLLATSVILLLELSSVSSSDVITGLGVDAGGCDSCGPECIKACGQRSFRACCFNYIKKKRSGGGSGSGLHRINDFDDIIFNARFLDPIEEKRHQQQYESNTNNLRFNNPFLAPLQDVLYRGHQDQEDEANHGDEPVHQWKENVVHGASSQIFPFSSDTSLNSLSRKR